MVHLDSSGEEYRHPRRLVSECSIREAPYISRVLADSGSLVWQLQGSLLAVPQPRKHNYVCIQRLQDVCQPPIPGDTAGVVSDSFHWRRWRRGNKRAEELLLLSAHRGQR